MYWNSILYLLTWPALIAVGYFVVVYALKKTDLLLEKESGSEMEAENG